MVMASGRWLGVRLDLLSSLLTGAVAFAAVLVSQDAGRYTLSELFSSRARNYSTSLTLMPSFTASCGPLHSKVLYLPRSLIICKL